jgi:N-acetylglucosamine malate deacetylase 2
VRHGQWQALSPLHELPGATSVLAVCAHPDDKRFGLGATVASFTAAGSSTAVLWLTHGESSTLGAITTELGQVRAAELADAASELGVDHVELLDYPDGALDREPIDWLAKHVCQVADRVRPDLLLVFDDGGVTGHLDHGRATEAALEFARDTRLPVLAWAVAQPVATTLNEEFGTTFVGRTPEDLDFEVHVDRGRQRRAIIRHASQATDNPVLLRRLEVQGDREVLRWLVAPSEGSLICARNGLSPLSDQDNDQEG